MLYRIITALVLAAVLGGLYLVFGDSGSTSSSTSSSPPTSSSSGSSDSLKGFKIP